MVVCAPNVLDVVDDKNLASPSMYYTTTIPRVVV